MIASFLSQNIETMQKKLGKEKVLCGQRFFFFFLAEEYGQMIGLVALLSCISPESFLQRAAPYIKEKLGGELKLVSVGSLKA